MGLCSTRITTWTLAIGGAVCIFLGLLLLTVISGVVDNAVLERSFIGYETGPDGTRELNEFTKKWVNPPFKMYLQVWLYDLKNEQDVLNGARPEVKEVGPFVFKELMKKNYKFSHNDTRVRYQNNRQYIFDESESCSTCKLSMNVTIPNVVFQKFVDIAAMGFLEKLAVEATLVALKRETPFLRVTVEEALFKGYQDPVISKLYSLCEKFNLTLICKDLPERIGFFYGQNNTFDGTYEIFTGLDSRQKIGTMLTWNNLTILPEGWWATKQARMINGTDGQLFPPLLQAGEDRALFTAQACRSVRLAYKSRSSIEGVPAYRYGVPDSMYDPTLPENQGFCNKLTPTFFNDTRIQPTGCLPAGLLDLSRCQPGNPRVYISQAHFLGSPEEVHDAVTGIASPDPNVDSTFVDIEATTGAVINAMRKAQINLGMRKGNLNIFEKTKDIIMPILWINETARFDSTTRDEMYYELWRAKHWVFGIGLTLIFLGAVVWLGFLGYHFVIHFCLPKPSDDTEALVTDSNVQVEGDNTIE